MKIIFLLQKSLLSIIMIFIFQTTFSQNIFSSTDAIKDFLDEKSYIVPEYGTIKFQFNNSDTKKKRETRIKDGADDEVVDLIFDVSIKRNKARKKDKTDYQVEMRIELNEDDNSSNPNSSYLNTFFLARNVIYPIKDFPAYYCLFADGDLYYLDVKYKKVPFLEYKTSLLKSNKFIWSNGSDFNGENSILTYKKCIQSK